MRRGKVDIFSEWARWRVGINNKTMINFFRRIRKKLADDNKPLKYMRYAIGEILLVVIGILIALSLNNWNENRNIEKLEIQYLNRLIKDLTIDTLYITSRIEKSQRVVNNHRNIIRSMYEKQKSIEDVKDLWKQIVWASEYLITQNATYEELTNSGNLSIFKNQELKTSIIYYYRENEQVAKHISEFDEVSTRHLIHLNHVFPNNIKFNPKHNDIFENLDLGGNEWEFFNDPSSEIFQTIALALSIYKLKHTKYIDEFLTLKNNSKKLINEINNELESRK